MKKQKILLVLKILETESDKRNPMTQVEIAEIISQVYPCDRKTIGRNIRFLIDLGYQIIKTPKGFYLDKKMFTLQEKEFIISAVRACAGIDEERKCNLIDRLAIALDKLYR